MIIEPQQPGRGPGPADGGDGGTPPPQGSDASPVPPFGDPPRRGRRTLAQREAAAKLGMASLDAERRRLRTRGAIVAGTLLARAVRARPALAMELAAALRELPERDREAVVIFAPELT